MNNDNDDYGFGGSMSVGVNYGNATANNDADVDRQPEMSSGPVFNLAPKGEALPVKDISTEEFMTEVMDASMNMPVLVDFWAPWCEPCKQLAPILEAAVAEAAGAIKLVKMNIDDHPEIPSKMGIKSIPAVVAFAEGKPVDAITGSQPASEIKAFIEKLVGPSGPSQLEQVLSEAEELMGSEAYQEAGQIYSAILQQLPNNVDAIAGLGTALLKLGDLEGAKGILANVDNYDKEVKLQALASAIDLEEQASDLGGLDELKEKVAKKPKDHQARFDLAIALNAKGEKEEAADHLLEIVKADRKWEEDGAKNQLIKFFEAWGPTDDATLTARRKLSSILFS